MSKAIRAVAWCVLLLASAGFSAETVTLTGKITCSMCKGKHQMNVSDDAECARKCVKYGAKYILMNGDGSYILETDPNQLHYYAEKTVTIRGELDGGKIVKIEAISIVK